MYTIQPQAQTHIANNALADHKELERRTQRNNQPEICPKSRRKASFLKKALSLVSSITNAIQQPNGLFQIA